MHATAPFWTLWVAVALGCGTRCAGFSLPAAGRAARASPASAATAAAAGRVGGRTALAVSASPTLEDVKDEYGRSVMETYGRFNLAMARGSGIVLEDLDGKKFLDFAAGISTCCLGHAHEGLAKAVAEQMTKVHHVSNLYYIPEQAELAKWLVEHSCADKAFFCNSGAEANEAAIKLARRHAVNRGIEKPVILTAKSSFHGRTMATITATGQPKYQKDFGPLLPGFDYVEYNDVAALEAAVAKAQASAGGGLAAIMMEPLQGEGGIRAGTQAFFKRARELADECGALLICDEVQTGMGRTGKLWGYMNTGVEPDVFTSAKALGGGVPIGAMLAKGDAAEVFGPGDHASTFGGNPLACAAGLTVANELSKDDFALLKSVQACGERLRAGLEDLKERKPGLIKEIRGWGLIDGVELDPSDSVPSAGQVVAKAIEGGLLTVPAGVKVVRFVPPLVVTEAEIDEALKIFEDALDAAIEDM